MLKQILLVGNLITKIRNSLLNKQSLRLKKTGALYLTENLTPCLELILYLRKYLLILRNKTI